MRIVTIDTGVLFPETLQTWRAFEQRFGVKIEVQDASSPGEPVERPGALLLGREGRGAGARARTAPRAGSPASAASRGRRAPRRELIERDERRGLWKYNPLAHWTDKDLWRRINERDLPYNPLHDQGYESIGCAPCTQPGAGREGRWAGTEKTECGLHVMSPRQLADERHMRDAAGSEMSVAARPQLSHLRALESEAIHVMREVAAEFERPVLLFSGGKDSIVLLRLAEKAFRPAPFPFPLMHVDTGHNFPEVIEFRDRRVAELGERLIVASVQDSIDSGRVVEETGPRASRNRLQTVTLLDAIAEHGFDAAFGGARRDEERARAKERDVLLPRRLRPVGPEEPAPGAVEPLQRAHPARASTCACSRSPTGPSSTCGSTSTRRSSRSPRSTSRTSARCSSATACSTPGARAPS